LRWAWAWARGEHSIFSKLPLAETPDADRRVKAVLLFLGERATHA
jgi:hypothetical protein